MATIIIQAPDSLSYSANLKKIIASSEVDISVKLEMGATEIFDLVYSPGVGGTIEVDLWRIVDKLLSVGIPTTNVILTEQTLGIADFTATVDTEVINFRAIKGGVAELQSMAGDFIDAHLLSWQPQKKRILQIAPEWLGVYATAERKIKVKAYFPDSTDETILLATAAAGKLYAVNVSWTAVNGELTKKDPVVWDVWMENSAGARLSFIQRYILRNAGSEENLYLWCNTLGGIDSFSMEGYLEDDKKLEHKISELIDESLDEYGTDKKREIRQSTGYLTTDESRWLEDFFISPARYQVRADGAIKKIVITESKVISTTADDQHEYEFTYRYADDPALLNLDRTLDPLPAPEGLTDFFLSELLSGLTTAQYTGNLLLAVQSPFAQGWQKLSFAELWEQALPTLVDNNTILFYDGKLRTNSGVIIDGLKPKHGFEAAADSVLSFNNSTLEFSITAKLGEMDFPVWNMGELLTKVTESVAIANTVGTWHIYYKDVVQPDLSVVSTLMATLTSWDRNLDIPIATVVWDGSAGVVKDYRYVYTEVNHAPLVRFEDKAHPAEDIYTDITNFNGLLDEFDTDLQKVLDKFDDHKHWKLYTPDYLNGFIYTSIVDGIPTLNILGNIIQTGSAYETHAEQVYTKDDLIILRDGAITGLSSGQYAGFKAKLYDGVNDGSLVFDNLGIARVGDVGFEQPIATRIETPTNDHFAYWEAENSRLNFKLLDTSFISENTNLYFTYTRAKAAIYSGLHANYLPYFDGTILVDSGAYWEETAYGVSTLIPGRLLELTSADDYQLRLGDGVTNPLYTYDIGRLSATGHLTFYGNQTGYIGYVFDGIDGELLHLDNVLATFAGGLKAVFASATTDTDKFIVSDTGVLKYRTGAEVLSDIGAQASHANLTSLSALNYVSASFVKMTAAGTFALDTTSYVTGTPWTGMGYVTGTPWTGLGYITSSALTGYVTLAWVGQQGYVTGTPWTGLGYITSSALTGYATQAWVGQQGYVTGTPWTGMGYLTSLAHNLTGDVSGAYGANTVDRIKNKAIPTLAAGFLKYDGTGFAFDATPASITGLHANYLPYFDGTILVDSGAYWEETAYGVSTLIPGRLLELTSADDYQLRLGDGVTNPLYTYDIGRLSATGHLTFYGNQTGYIGYVFDGIDGKLLHMDNVLATFAGGLKAVFASATTDTDKFIVSDTGVLKYRTGAEVLSDIGAQASHANLTSLSALSYASASFVKMTAAGTFALDTTSYVTGTPWTGMGYVTGTPWTGMGYLTSEHTHSYLPLSGGALTGGLSGTTISMSGTITGSEVYRGSSRELKTNILDFDIDAITFLNCISIKKYNLKDNGLFGIGFIAEDTHQWLSGDDQKSHIFGNHLGILTKAIQDEDKKVEDLMREVLEMKQQVKDLQDGRR